MYIGLFTSIVFDVGYLIEFPLDIGIKTKVTTGDGSFDKEDYLMLRTRQFSCGHAETEEECISIITDKIENHCKDIISSAIQDKVPVKVKDRCELIERYLSEYSLILSPDKESISVIKHNDKFVLVDNSKMVFVMAIKEETTVMKNCGPRLSGCYGWTELAVAILDNNCIMVGELE